MPSPQMIAWQGPPDRTTRKRDCRPGRPRYLARTTSPYSRCRTAADNTQPEDPPEPALLAPALPPELPPLLVAAHEPSRPLVAANEPPRPLVAANEPPRPPVGPSPPEPGVPKYSPEQPRSSAHPAQNPARMIAKCPRLLVTPASQARCLLHDIAENARLCRVQRRSFAPVTKRFAKRAVDQKPSDERRSSRDFSSTRCACGLRQAPGHGS